MAEPTYPDDLLYHDQHDWARLEGDEHAVLGVTWYAQDSLGEVVFYDPPEAGATIVKDSSYAEVESVKAVSELYAPIAGEVIEVNDKVAADPALLSTDPYELGWLIKMKLPGLPDTSRLKHKAAYDHQCEAEAH